MSLSEYPLTEHQASELRSQPHLNQLRQAAKSVEKSILLPGTPQELWPLVCHTDFLNRGVGMQATQNSYLQREYGSTWMHAETRNAGLAVAYEELPYEWEAPHAYRVERIHSKGPLRYLSFGVKLQAAENDHTTLTCQIQFVSHLPAAIARVLIGKEIQKFIQFFEQLAQRRAKGDSDLRCFFDPSPHLESKIEALSQSWQDFEPLQPARQAIADYILRAPERLAYRLRPTELAHLYALDPLEVLKACLRLTRENQLTLMWNCRCPGCKGPKETFAHLSSVKDLAYCPTCAVSYGLAFDQNLELSFQPHPSLRATQEQFFCAGSPGNTPHISWQQNFLPLQTRHFDLKIPEGHYILRTLSCNNALYLTLGPEGNESLAISIDDHLGLNNSEETPPQILLKTGASLQIQNHKAHEVTLSLENLHWQALAVTAAEVQSVQAFHDLFPDEILAAGERLPLASQIFLAAHLENSAADFSAENREEIHTWIKHTAQQHEGAALLHENGWIQALFARPFEALSAAWSLLQELETLNLLYENPLQLSLGLAEGPCQVFSQAQRLEYTGPGWEEAQKAAELSQAQALVVKESLFQNAETGYFLDLPEAQASRLESTQDQRWIVLKKIATLSLEDWEI